MPSPHPSSVSRGKFTKERARMSTHPPRASHGMFERIKRQLEHEFLAIERNSALTEDQKVSRLIKTTRSEEHTSELQSRENLVCRLLLEKKKIKKSYTDLLNKQD